MTDRAAVVTKIRAVIEELTGVTAAELPADKRIEDHDSIDSLDAVEIAMHLEEDFFPDGVGELEPEPDWTIDKIADAVLAQLAKQTSPTA